MNNTSDRTVLSVLCKSSLLSFCKPSQNTMRTFLPVIVPTVFCCWPCSAYQHKIKVEQEGGSAVINADSLRQHIAVLSADSFMGRKPITVWKR